MRLTAGVHGKEEQVVDEVASGHPGLGILLVLGSVKHATVIDDLENVKDLSGYDMSFCSSSDCRGTYCCQRSCYY